VRGSGGSTPTGVVRLDDLGHTSPLPNGQPAFHVLATGTLVPGANPDEATVVFDSKQLRRRGSEWGNLHIRAEYLGDATYAATGSPEFVENVYREKSDLDGDGL